MTSRPDERMPTAKATGEIPTVPPPAPPPEDHVPKMRAQKVHAKAPSPLDPEPNRTKTTSAKDNELTMWMRTTSEEDKRHLIIWNLSTMKKCRRRDEWQETFFTSVVRTMRNSKSTKKHGGTLNWRFTQAMKVPWSTDCPTTKSRLSMNEKPGR